jgi:Ubiquinol cytochrome reductase transmembrane region
MSSLPRLQFQTVKSPSKLTTSVQNPHKASIPTLIHKRYFSSPVTHASAKQTVANPPSNHYLKDLKNYDDISSRNSAYFLVGAYSAVGAMAAKNIVTDYLQNLSASADVLALAKVFNYCRAKRSKEDSKPPAKREE